MEESGLPAIQLKSVRDRTIDQLCAHFANDALELKEFEKRLDLANRAVTVADLERLTADLPVVATPVQKPAIAQQPTTSITTWPRARQFLVAIMGGFARRGRWSPAKQTVVVAFWGGGELDFREANFPPGVTELTILACMGGAEVIVPPGINVESEGIAIMGGFEHSSVASDPNAPTLRINGLALMGGVDVKVRYPGESNRDARARMKEERRVLRDEARRYRE